MKKILMAAVGIAAVAGAGGYWFSHRTPASAEAPYVVPLLTKNYENDEYKFSLKMPESFEASEIDNEEGGKTVILQDKDNNGVQISISPFADDPGDGYTLTQGKIAQDVPDMQMSDVQPVEVGAHYTGIAFKSDNEAFSGASREVWFVFRGNLYQISTYEQLDDLLKAIFATWQFDAS